MREAVKPLKAKSPDIELPGAAVARIEQIRVDDERRKYALSAPALAATVTVTNEGEMQDAAIILQGIKEAEEWFDRNFDDPISLANKLHKALVAQKRQFTESLTRAKIIIKGKVQAFLDDRRREAERIERERQAALQKAQDEAEAVKNEGQEKAASAEAFGDIDGAIHHLETSQAKAQEIFASAAEQASEAPVAKPIVAGLRSGVEWKYRIVNAALIPREYYSLDLKKIERVVDAMKGQTNIPGVIVFSSSTVSIT